MTSPSACIPLGLTWSSPFARWQGPFAELSSLELATQVTRAALTDRGLSPDALTAIVLGWTVPQKGAFYGAPTVAAEIGAPGITGPMIAQACATSVACLREATATALIDRDTVTVVVTSDRTSNGPHLVWPSPGAVGGQPVTEDWVLDNFRRDPWAGKAMIETAERVAAEAGFTREEIDNVTLLRYQQYATALVDDRAFQRSYMVGVTVPQQRGDPLLVDADAGVHETTAEGLGKLEPTVPGGVVTYGSQTHPADGTAGMVVTGEERARELSGEGVARILGTGVARVAPATMPKAPVPAARMALDRAGLTVADVDAVTTHNPFAVNDLWLSRQMGIPLERMNERGCSLVYGHPQAPTGARAIVELIELLRVRGGGVGLFTGCAAGDTGAAMVLRVED